jgi:hypothetical protein
MRAARAGIGRGGKLPPFVVALMTYTVMGVLMAFGLRSGDDLFVYSLFTISAAMFMTALTVIMEYVSIVVNPDDYAILAHRPVSSRTYFWAKMGNLLFYVTPISLALTSPAAVVGSLSLDEGAAFGITHVLIGLVACITTAAGVVLVYTAALKVVSYQRFTSVMTYVHSGATLVLVLGYFLLPRLIEEDAALLSLSRGAWVYFTPPAWFAGAVEFVAQGPQAQNLYLALIAVGAAFVVIASAMNTISLDYSRKISALVTSSSEPEPVQRSRPRRRPFFALGMATLTSGEERAGYVLMDAYMRRDRKLRARVYPAFGLPLAVYVCALVRSDLHSPFVPHQGSGPVALQEIMALYCVFVSLFFASAMAQSEQWRASWIFHAAPLGDPARLLRGARRLVLWRYLVPFFLLLLTLLSVAMPFLGAVTFVMLILPLCLTAFAVLTLASPHLPLSQEVEKTRQVRQIAYFMVLSATLMPLLILLQMMIAGKPIYSIPIIAALWIAAWVTELAVGAALRRRLTDAEFAG